MRFGYWMPVFGGWLRNVDDESMDASFAYNKKLARRSEAIGWDLTLIAELFLNDIKGIAAPCPIQIANAIRSDAGDFHFEPVANRLQIIHDHSERRRDKRAVILPVHFYPRALPDISKIDFTVFCQ